MVFERFLKLSEGPLLGSQLLIRGLVVPVVCVERVVARPRPNQRGVSKRLMVKVRARRRNELLHLSAAMGSRRLRLFAALPSIRLRLFAALPSIRLRLFAALPSIRLRLFAALPARRRVLILRLFASTRTLMLRPGRRPAPV
jgi:hypothetical protein